MFFRQTAADCIKLEKLVDQDISSLFQCMCQANVSDAKHDILPTPAIQRRLVCFTSFSLNVMSVLCCFCREPRVGIHWLKCILWTHHLMMVYVLITFFLLYRDAEMCLSLFSDIKLLGLDWTWWMDVSSQAQPLFPLFKPCLDLSYYNNTHIYVRTRNMSSFNEIHSLSVIMRMCFVLL